MKASDITIVHLSDLHFDGKREMIYEGLLLSDIQHQIRHSQKLMIVVTGDLAMYGNVKPVKKSILDFFERLNGIVPEKCELLAVEVVPGNHDLERPKIENAFNNGSYKNNLNEFDKLLIGIQKIFRKSIIGKNIRDKGRVGVTYIPYNNQEIALVRLDTSGADIESEMLAEIKKDLASSKKGRNVKKSKAAERPKSAQAICKLRLKAVQQDIKEQGIIIQNSFCVHDSKKRMRRLLTIVLAHHPLTWIKESGIDKVHDTLFKRGLGYTDLWLCGHMHMSQLYYTSENNHQKVMLMSGLGRQDSQHTFMRYSIYNISLERNVCAVQSRGATGGARFAEDHAMGRPSSNDVDHLTIPLRSNQIGVAIRLNNSGQKRAVKDYYVDDTVLALFREIRERIEWCRRNVMRKIEEGKLLLLEQLMFGVGKRTEDAAMAYMDWRLSGKKNQITEASVKIIRKVVLRLGLVRHFFKQICDELYQCVTRPIERFEDEPISPIYWQKFNCNDIQWRFHFRKYKGFSVPDGMSDVVSDKYVSYVTNLEEDSMQEVKWTGFIRNAFNHAERCLVQSANQGQNPIDTKWDDFLTSIPRFRNSLIELRNNEGRYELRPILSFGVSIKCKTQESLVFASLILYAFEFLDINKTIGELTEQFLDSVFVDDIRSFLA